MTDRPRRRPQRLFLTKLIATVSALGLLAFGAMAEAQGCDTPESHQFDFWVGHWQVFPTAQPQHHVADSLIEKLYDGCAIRENWKPLKAGDGGSLSSYLPDLKQWRQSWIDVTGQWVDYRGAWNGTAMVLTGATPQPGHPNQITRMTYTVQADGAVRQLGEVSDDQGKTWSPGFDFLYRKAA